jgi:hypothetical protein
VFRFRAVDMTLVAEGCALAVDARVWLLSVKVVSRGCGCVWDSGCADIPEDVPERTMCYPPDSGAGRCGRPGSFSPGMCRTTAGCDTDVPIGTP